MGYLKLWDSALDSPKVQKLPGDLFKFWVNLLLLTNRCGGISGEIPTEIDIGFAARERPKVVASFLARLCRAGLLDPIEENPVGGALYRVHDFAQWQDSKDKTAAERMRRYRANKANGYAQRNGVTRVTGTVTNPDESSPDGRNVARNGRATLPPRRIEGIKKEEKDLLPLSSGDIPSPRASAPATPTHEPTPTRGPTPAPSPRRPSFEVPKPAVDDWTLQRIRDADDRLGQPIR
jgi:hypothetical protein